MIAAGRRDHLRAGGSLEYQIDGRPTNVYNAGEALTVLADVIHAVRNVGTATATELATYVVPRRRRG